MRTVIITGANRLNGIGYQIASELVSRGDQVIITARNLQSGSVALKALGSNARLLALDLTKPKAIENFAREFSEFCPTLDVLINNSGVLLDSTVSVLETTAQLFLETFSVNTVAPVLLSQSLLPFLRKSKSPRIINVSSGAGQLSDGELSNWAPAYSASKAALNALTQQLASTLPGISINSVCPGWCKTDMGGKEAPRTAAQGAETIVWLATDADQKITGKFFRDKKEIPW